MLFLGFLFCAAGIVSVLGGPLKDDAFRTDLKSDPPVSDQVSRDPPLRCDILTPEDAGSVTCRPYPPEDTGPAAYKIKDGTVTDATDDAIKVAVDSTASGDGVPSNPPRLCCPKNLRDSRGNQICGADLCYGKWDNQNDMLGSVNSMPVRTIKKSTSNVDPHQKDMCCFTNGLQVFDCHLCNTTPPTDSFIHDKDTGDRDLERLIKPTTTSTVHSVRNIEAQPRPCCFKGSGAAVYDCGQCKHGPQSAPPHLKRAFELRNDAQVCCWDNEIVKSTCWVCQDKPFEASAVVWQPRPSSEDGSIEFVRELPILSGRALASGRADDLCCWPKTTSLSTCWECDSTKPLFSNFEIWQTQNGKPYLPSSNNSIEFKVIGASHTNHKQAQETGDRCCVVNRGVATCVDCPSATSATAIAAVPADTAIVTHKVRKEQNQCCGKSDANSVCHDCDAEPRDTALAKVATTSTNHPTPNFKVTCYGSLDQVTYKCQLDGSFLSGSICKSSCECNGVGEMICGSPGVTLCTDLETTNFCSRGSQIWRCACT